MTQINNHNDPLLREPAYAKMYLSAARDEYQKNKDRKKFLSCCQDVAEAQRWVIEVPENYPTG